MRRAPWLGGPEGLCGRRSEDLGDLDPSWQGVAVRARAGGPCRAEVSGTGFRLWGRGRLEPGRMSGLQPDREARLPPPPAGKQRQELPWRAVPTGPEDWPGADTLTELPGACPHTGGDRGRLGLISRVSRSCGRRKCRGGCLTGSWIGKYQVGTKELIKEVRKAKHTCIQ